MKNIEDKELEIKVKKIILHNKIHALLQEIKPAYLKALKEPGEISNDEEDATQLKKNWNDKHTHNLYLYSSSIAKFQSSTEMKTYELYQFEWARKFLLRSASYRGCSLLVRTLDLMGALKFIFFILRGISFFSS